jgi:hypothetical protein
MSRLQLHFSETGYMKVFDKPFEKPLRRIVILPLYHNDVPLANTIPVRSS